MKKARQERIVNALIPKDQHDNDAKKYDLIYRLLRERHELQQVCLEVFRGLEKSPKTKTVEYHWQAELHRVLFDQGNFLY